MHSIARQSPQAAATTASLVSARNIILTITVRSCSIPTATTSKRYAERHESRSSADPPGFLLNREIISGRTVGTASMSEVCWHVSVNFLACNLIPKAETSQQGCSTEWRRKSDEFRKFIAAAVVLGFLACGVPSVARADGWGDYDSHHEWHSGDWWLEHNPGWLRSITRTGTSRAAI